MVNPSVQFSLSRHVKWCLCSRPAPAQRYLEHSPAVPSAEQQKIVCIFRERPAEARQSQETPAAALVTYHYHYDTMVHQVKLRPCCHVSLDGSYPDLRESLGPSMICA